jgi:hypothetical protein
MPTEYEAERVVESVWKLWERDISLAAAGMAIPVCPAFRATAPTFQFA